MGIFQRIEQKFFTGHILKDYGVIYEDASHRSGTVRYSLLLTQKKSGTRIIIKQKSNVNITSSVTYHEFDRVGAQKLHEVLGEALERCP